MEPGACCSAGKNTFELEYNSTIDDFLDSMYLAGAELGGTKLESYARSIERSNKMLKLLNSAVNLLRSKHKHGEQVLLDPVLQLSFSTAAAEYRRNY